MASASKTSAPSTSHAATNNKKKVVTHTQHTELSEDLREGYVHYWLSQNNELTDA
jgi:hypothetical protein